MQGAELFYFFSLTVANIESKLFSLGRHRSRYIVYTVNKKQISYFSLYFTH